MAESVYDVITKRIIQQLKEGIIPWEKPWERTMGAYNYVSKKTYSMLNQMLLTYKGPYATYKQWAEKGGKVRRGEKSEMIVFWKPLIKKKQEENGEDGEKEEKEYFKKSVVLRYYRVFHISQVDGIKEVIEDKKTLQPILEAEILLHSYLGRARVNFLSKIGLEAAYNPVLDRILLPGLNEFRNIEEYYSTAFHETVHSTGHHSRLSRFDKAGSALFGSEAYSKEELIAEIGSATILNRIGIETKKSFRNNVAYIQNWLSVLEGDERFIVSASSKAEKAVKYIMSEIDSDEEIEVDAE